LKASFQKSRDKLKKQFRSAELTFAFGLRQVTRDHVIIPISPLINGKRFKLRFEPFLFALSKEKLAFRNAEANKKERLRSRITFVF